MRLFITVNMDEKVRDEIYRVIPTVRAGSSGGNFVPKENLHITMLFLGEVPDDEVNLVTEAMELAVKDTAVFKLWINNLGSFQHRETKILWAGVDGDLPQLEELYNRLVKNIRERKIPHDAKPRYTPHVTLARKVKKDSKVNEAEIKLQTDPWQVDSLELYQSTFSDSGVKYKRILAKKFSEQE